MDLPVGARTHPPNRPGSLGQQYSRQDRATSIPNGLGRCRRMADCDAGDEPSRFAFPPRAPRPRRNHRVQTTAAHHCHAPDFGHRLDRDRVPHPSDAIAGSTQHSKLDARNRPLRAHFDSRADVDTSDCLLRHPAHKSEVVGASQLAVKFHESLSSVLRSGRLYCSKRTSFLQFVHR